MIDRIRGLYFSSHHLTRDVIGNVAPLTAFTALVIAFYGPAQAVAATFFREYLAEVSFWAFVLALIAYLIGGYFVGTVAGFTANFLHRILRRLPRFGQQCSYTYWYSQDANDIDALYSKLFPDYQYLSSGAAVTPTDKINALKQYFRKYDPRGYAEAYRQFMKVDLVRASLFYPLALMTHQLYLFVKSGMNTETINGGIVIISVVVLAMALAELPRRIRKVVRTEYFFIIAAARIREDIQQGIPS